MSNSDSIEDQQGKSKQFPVCYQYQDDSTLFSHKKIDLITNLEAHVCDYCHNDLNSFTKIIAEVPPNSEDKKKIKQPSYKVYCVSCFAGWSSKQIGREQLRPPCSNYYVLKSTDQEQPELDSWSVKELHTLMDCICEGQVCSYNSQTISMGKQFKQKFEERTDSKRTVDQLAVEYDYLCRNLFAPDLLESYIDQNQEEQQEQNIDLAELDVTNILNSWEFDSQQAQRKAQKMLEQIRYNSLNQHQRLYPDNHSDFIAKIMAESEALHLPKGQQKGVAPSRNNKAMMMMFKRQLQAKQKEQKQINRFLAKFIFKHSKTRKRENSEALKSESVDKINIQKLEPLEQAGFSGISDFEQLLKEVSELKEERAILTKDIRQKQKQNNSFVSAGSKSLQNRLQTKQNKSFQSSIDHRSGPINQGSESDQQ